MSAGTLLRVTRGGRHRKLKRRTGIVSAALIVAAGLAVTVSIETASHTLTPAADASTSGTVQGTDVYGSTDVSDWGSIAGAGMGFAGIEADDGANNPNGNYATQVTGALNAGLFVMPYILGDPYLVANGGDQFTNGWNVISTTTAAPYATGGEYLPIALDMEDQSAALDNKTNACYGLSTANMQKWIGQFIAAAKAKTGLTPVVYSSPNWWKACVGTTSAFSADPLWIADYGVGSPAIPAGWSAYAFWQYSDSGTVNGVTGKADLDEFVSAPQLLTAKAGSSGSAQVETLNSLAGQPVTYAGTGLPAGVSVSTLKTGGLLSWSPSTRAGRYTITVTPSSATGAVLPSAIPVTLKVHGSISLAVAKRSTTAGAPVQLRVGASGPDQSAGYPATVKAAGLPPGLSMSATGEITGWASKPGTYKVTVAAADALGGAGSASFTWTIAAAANSGTTGPIRQAGGSAKCLDDPSGRTANGTGVDLSSCTGKSSQNWTVVQDGTIRTGGKCLDVVGGARTNGAKLQLYTCSSADLAQVWQAATDGQLINLKSGKCLDVPVAKAGNGTRPVIEPCANSTTSPNEHWLRPAAPVLSGEPAKCLAASGSAVVVATCANTAAQHWQPQPDGTVRLSGKCLTESGTAAGSALSLGSCSGASATKWKLASKGPIAVELASPASGLCVTIPPAGTRLTTATCADTPTGTWHLE